MTQMNRLRRCGALLTVGLIAVAGCTRPENAVPTGTPLPGVSVPTSTTADTPDDSPTSTTAPPTTTPNSSPTTAPPPPTTVPATSPPTTTARAATTTTVLPTSPADLTLHFDGVLPYRFGERDVDVVPGLVGALGPPVSDEPTEYPTAEEGVFLDETGEISYVSPFGRTVCFASSLCLQFGAGAPGTLIFTGWRIDDGTEPDLATEDGIAIGSTLADHADVITFDPAVSCYQVAYGTAAGVDMMLLSGDGVFAAPNPDGDGLVLGDPDPALVTVQSMSAGELPVFLFADC